MAAQEAKRRLAAILKADVAGYSRLIGEDADFTVRTLTAYRTTMGELVVRHGGLLVGTPGDSFLAEFPSVAEMVDCAVSIQNALKTLNEGLPPDRRVQFRIGLNLGDTIHEGNDIHGDGVNIAARLEALAPPGGICVSRVVHEQVRSRPFHFEDLGEHPVKNIAEPVRAYRLDPAAVSTATAVAGPKSELPSTDLPSLAVLPFVNMSGDPEQEYFADGISEDIITSLSKLRWFLVIARNSSFAYKGKAIDVKRVASELDVRYVLEGSVRKGGDRVRITAQLIEASTGKHIWADRHDGELTDIFALQDEVTKKVVAAIEPRLLEAEGIRSQNRSPEDLSAWDMVIRANSLFWRMTKSEGEAATAILTRAVELYPDYAPAHSMLAFALLVSGFAGWTLSEHGPRVKQAETLAARASELDHQDPWAHLALGYVAFTRRRTEEAVEAFERAIELNPNFAAAHGYLGSALALDGRSEKAIAHFEVALRMSPHDPQNAIFYAALAAAHYLAGRYTEAIGFARKAIHQRYGFTGGHRIYVASLAQAGQIEEARTALERLKVLHHDFSIEWIEKYVPYTPGPMAKFLEGMRKAGLQ